MIIKKLFPILAIALLGLADPASAENDSSVISEVGPVPDEFREEHQLDPFYQKFITSGPLPILGSERVSDYALREAAWIVQKVIGNRPDILQAMADNGVRMVIMAYNEYTTDVPEQRNMQPKAYWDRRARGLGGRIISGAEENLLCFPNDPYSTENILIHEFGHIIHGSGLRTVDPTFNRRLREAYSAAKEAGLWEGTYAGSNPGEYWAEAVQDWFDNNRENDSIHNHVDTRAELKEYDPALAALCSEVFGEGAWRYQKPMDRPEAERAHLAGFDFSKAPRFEWRSFEDIERPRIQIETGMGNIEAELFAEEAPETVRNFLRYVQDGLYSGGRIFRTVTLDNQPDDEVKIEVIQMEANPAKEEKFYPPIALERTSKPGLEHRDGTLSMARSTPDSAQHSFSICIGDQPELDFAGKRNPDGQGFAAFGRVTKGMDIVKKIQNSPADGQQLTPPVNIVTIIRLE
jgi:cyclophilin family peptidyl-prolyl cis-trans isomerase